LSKPRIHDHGVPLGAAEQILYVDVVEILLRLHAVERRLLMLLGPAVCHSTHVRLLLLLLLLLLLGWESWVVKQRLH
jgi:hypothetical protein